MTPPVSWFRQMRIPRRARSGHSSRRIGIVNPNVAPAPTWLLTQILPPCSSMNFRHKVSPSPVPSAFFSAVPTCPELLEHRLTILRRNADPGVGDRHLD